MANKNLGVGAGVQPAAIVRDSQSLDELTAQAKAMHRTIDVADRMNLDRARQLGEILVRIKAKCKHGEWLPRVKKMEIPQQRVSEYMRLFKLPGTGNFLTNTLSQAVKALAPDAGEADEPEDRKDGEDEEDEEDEGKPDDVDAFGRKKTKKKKRKAEPRGELKDRTGATVPDSCRDAFADTSLAELIAELEAVESQLSPESVVTRAGKLAPHYPFIVVGDLNEHAWESKKELQVTLEALRAGLPYAVCPKCKGEPNGATCKTCRGCGHIPEHRFKELKGG